MGTPDIYIYISYRLTTIILKKLSWKNQGLLYWKTDIFDLLSRYPGPVRPCHLRLGAMLISFLGKVLIFSVGPDYLLSVLDDAHPPPCRAPLSSHEARPPPVLG